MIKISCQEQLLPGQTLQEKFEFARSAGYDGIELRARGDFAFRDRLPELRRAARDGVPMPSVCVDMSHFFGYRRSSHPAVRRRTGRSCSKASPNWAGTPCARARRSPWSRSTGMRITWSTGWSRRSS